MKIISIEFENLNSLTGRWKIDFAAQDFAESGIFAITGKTGAGKTTILDAVSIALFGRTPRVKISGSENEVMSKNRGSCLAEIVFENNGKNYVSRFEQRRSRGRPDGALQSVQRSVQELGNPATLVTMQRDVDAKVPEYLGMDYDQFMRSVMLAQGQFNTFLMAESGDKSKILEKITGTAQYEKISQKTFELAKRARESYERLRLETQSVSLLSEGDEQAVKAELDAKEKTTAIQTESRRQLELKIQKGQEQDSLRKSIIQKELLLNGQNQKIADFEPQKQRLLQALKIEPLTGDFNSWKEKKQKMLTAQQRSATIDEELQKVQLRVKESQGQAVAAKTEMTEFAQRKKNAEEQIIRARSLDDKYKILDQTLQVCNQTLLSARKAAIEAEKEVVMFRAEISRRIECCQQAEQYLKEHEKDGDLECLQLELNAVLKDLPDIKQKLATAQKNVGEKKKRKLQTVTILTEIKCEAEICNNKLQAKKTEIEAKKAKIAAFLDGKSPADYRRRKEELMAEYKSCEKIQAYRQDLVDGKPCPLCGSLHHPLDSATGNENEKKLVREIAELELKISAIENLETEIKNENPDLEKLAERKNAAEKQLIEQSGLLKQLDSEISAVDESMTSLLARQNEINDAAEEIYIRYGINKELSFEEIKSRSTQYQKNKAAYETLKTATAVGQNELKNLEKNYEQLKIRKEEATQAAAEQKKRCEENRTERWQQFGEWDCNAKTAELQQQENRLKIKCEQADEQLKKTEKDEAALVAAYQAEIRYTAELQQESTALETKLKLAAAEYGFGELSKLSALFMDQEERENIQKKLNLLEQEAANIKLQINNEQEKLEQLQVKYPVIDLEILQKEHSEITEAINELNRQIGALRQKLADNNQRRAGLEEKLMRLQNLKSEKEAWGRLDDLIGSSTGKKFREFAQGIAFDVLIGFANRQLRQMSDRYTLIRTSELGLDVIDNYQGGEQRAVKNLSGGESFMVSLALALGLSKMSSRRIRIDSLFLDEGFGTLDEEALNTTLDALSRLERENKLIGIISHVAALKESIPIRIEVVKISGGNSRLKGAGCLKVDDNG